jgi:hypothetical protein
MRRLQNPVHVMRVLVLTLAGVLFGGCNHDQDPIAVLDDMQTQHLQRIAAAAAPLVEAIERHKAATGKYPESVAEVRPRLVDPRGLLPAPETGAFGPFEYRVDRVASSFYFYTCEHEPRRGFIARDRERCARYLPPEKRGPESCSGGYALGVERRVGNWCVLYGETPPS